jgi:iron-regulated transporter 1
MNAVGEVQSLQVGEGGPNGSGLDASLLRRLYVAQFLTRWGARCAQFLAFVIHAMRLCKPRFDPDHVCVACSMWEFSVGLYMIRIWPDSLLLAAIYGVVESSSVAVFGPMVGSLVHRLTYLQVRQLLRFSCLSSLSTLVLDNCILH